MTDADTPDTNSPQRKASAKKAAANKSAAKKTTAKKAAAKTTPRRTARKDASGRSATDPRGPRLAAMAAEQLVVLTGKGFEGVVGLSRSDDGWRVEVELLEVRRIPNTTDMLAVYEVELDPDGELTGYRRQCRYVRGQAREDR